MTRYSESRKEAIHPRLLTTKSTTHIGAWNVRTMYETGKANTVAKEMRVYKLQVLGISQTRWSDETKLIRGANIILYSEHPDDNVHHTEGVALMLGLEAQKALIGWEPVSSRIITAKFLTNHKRIHLNIIQCYAPTNDAEETAKDEFYDRLGAVIRTAKERDVTILMGDLNAKVGTSNIGYEQIMGKHGLGTMNENGEMFANLCAEHNLVIGATLFPHKQIHKATWVSPDGVTENQIDHICINKKFRTSMKDVRVRRGADAASDHHLVVTKLKLKLKRCNNNHANQKRYNVSMLADPTKQDEYRIKLTNRYQALQELEEDSITTENRWQQLKKAWVETCEETVGTKKSKQREWITPGTLNKVKARKEMKNILNNSKTRASKQEATKRYNEANKAVKTSARQDKRRYIETLAKEAEEAAGQRNMKALYDTTRKLAGKKHKMSRPVKNKDGETLNTTKEQIERWAEHFKELLNQIPPVTRANIPPAEVPLPINCNRPSKTEIKKAIKLLKNNKAPGPDSVPAEALKADINTSTDMLFDLFGEIWKEDYIPKEWKEGHIIKLPMKGNLSECNNYRGIMLLSAPGIVVNGSCSKE